jgi:quinoprotein glucose dehydrogenase
MNPYLLVLLLLLSGKNVFARAIDPEGNWNGPCNNGGADSTHYSPLKTKSIAKRDQLQVAWTYDAADASPARRGVQSGHVNGVLYATTAKLNVIAIDAAMGKLLWRLIPTAMTQ